MHTLEDERDEDGVAAVGLDEMFERAELSRRPESARYHPPNRHSLLQIHTGQHKDMGQQSPVKEEQDSSKDDDEDQTSNNNVARRPSQKSSDKQDG
jgi:hypothetical protein